MVERELATSEWQQRQFLSGWVRDNKSNKSANTKFTFYGAERAIRLALPRYMIMIFDDDFLMIAQRCQDPQNRFSQSFHQMKVLWVQMIDLDLF